ncbi:unnamed protein product [Enterobius vermicularis]|uniref:4-hydroxybenzoate polyprenyltransferase, mitochondrial n=1 Tax=Enterobius vermicularis TaxID=51028 RepID=A0A0N4VBB5_ENTVE|nr:unnamed protein product [Enterobius vermicularis]
MFIRSPLKLCCTVSKAIVWRELIFRISATLGSTVPRPKQAAEETSVFSSAYLVKKAPLSWQPYLKLMRVDKPTGTWLLFWPCAWSIGLAAPAGAWPNLQVLALFGAGSFLMRAGGCVINDILDQKQDKMVERTRNRPLPSGQLTNKDAVITLGFLLSGSLAVLLQFNWFSVAVGASSLIFALLYPFAKRWTYWPQVVLGITLNYGVLISWAHLLPNNFLQVTPLFVATVIHTIIYDSIYSHQVYRVTSFNPTLPSRAGFAFNYGVILGWAAIKNSFDLVIMPFYIGLIAWTVVYDTIYALQDKIDDVIAGVKSTALLWGDQTKYWLTGFASLATGLLCVSGIITHQTWPYYLGLAGTAAHLGWQIGTLKIDEPADCWSKFKSNQVCIKN